MPSRKSERSLGIVSPSKTARWRIEAHTHEHEVLYCQSFPCAWGPLRHQRNRNDQRTHGACSFTAAPNVTVVSFTAIPVRLSEETYNGVRFGNCPKLHRFEINSEIPGS